MQNAMMRTLSIAAVIAVCLSVDAGSTDCSQPIFDTTAQYIVQLEDAPVARYQGGVAGLAATDPRVIGAVRLDVYAPRSLAYLAYLRTRQTDMLESARSALGRPLIPRFQYHYALNGMSVRLTRAEAARLAALPGVASVQLVQRYHIDSTGIPASAGDTDASRAWIQAPTLWQLPSHGHGDTEGEGMVLADLDTGINSGNSSFASTGPKDGYVTLNPLGSGHFLGVCDPANAQQHPKQPAFFNCNDKLIGAYTYVQGVNDPGSPEDSEGHGSHTASTVAGNFVDVFIVHIIGGLALPISGVAPHANVIAYDVCDPKDSCSGDGAVAAVEQAIQDQTTIANAAGAGFGGMVLNFSVSGGEDPYNDEVELAFLSAVEAGIFVSTSAGNGGPSNDPSQQSAVDHVGPWVLSVAATTHDGVLHSVLTSSGGTAPPAPLTGSSITPVYGPAEIVYAGNYSYPNNYQYTPFLDPNSVTGPATAPTTPAEVQAAAAQCFFPFPPNTFPPGSIVVCDRGIMARVQKAINVSYSWGPGQQYTSGNAGAGGFVLANAAVNGTSLSGDTYVVPGVQLVYADAQTLEAWLSANSSPNPLLMARIGATTVGHDATQADQVAGFSSRGPAGLGTPTTPNTAFDNLVKPDLTAPGVSVLAAVSNPAYTNGESGAPNQPESFAFFDGTSMSAPHVAGAAALLKSLHPTWTPAELSSALMLTSVTTLTDQCATLVAGACTFGSAVPSPFVRGAGRIDVDAANRSGLLLDENGTDYTAANPTHGGDLTHLNLASLGNDNCAATCNWTRTLKSAFTGATAHYTVSVDGQTGGLQITVSPTSFNLAPGATQMLSITADVSNVAIGTWNFAQANITSASSGDGGMPISAAHMPLAVFAVTPPPPPPPPPPSKSGGGSLGWLVIGILLAAVLRRRF